MKDHNLEQLKKQYMNISIPSELDGVVNKAINKVKGDIKRKKYFRNIGIASASVACTLVIGIISIKSNLMFPNKIDKTPVLDNTTKSITARKYVANKEDVNKEDLTKDTVNKENVNKDTVIKENVVKENVNKDTVIKENVVKENVAKENVAKKNLVKENLVKEDVAKENVTKEDVTKENLDEENVNKDINVASIQMLQAKKSQSSLNEKYIEENKKLYEDFMADIKDLNENKEDDLVTNSEYKVITDTDEIFSIKRYLVAANTRSLDEKIKYDTIDKKNQVLITLPSLFKDDTYINVISNNIKNQMQEQMVFDNSKIYWIEDHVNGEYQEPFKEISKEQNFYINKENKLVISFDKGEVAPEYMGNPEFVIATEILSNILVDGEYIK